MLMRAEGGAVENWWGDNPGYYDDQAIQSISVRNVIHPPICFWFKLISHRCSNLIFCIRDYLHIEKGFQTKWPLEMGNGDPKYRKWKHSLKSFHRADLMLWLNSDWTWICNKHIKYANQFLKHKTLSFWLKLKFSDSVRASVPY